MRKARLYTTSADYAYQELRHKIVQNSSSQDRDFRR